MTKLFISHSSQDDAFVRDLQQALADHGQPTLQFTLNFFPSGSSMVGNTRLVQAHTSLDKAARCFWTMNKLNQSNQFGDYGDCNANRQFV